MSEKLFLDIGKALEPMMIGFEKVKQFLIKGILEPLTKVTSGVIYLIQKLTELVVYVSSKLVEGFKIAFDPIIKLFQKAVEMAGKLTENIKKIFGLSKKSEEEKNEKDAASSEPERLKKFDPSAINDFNKQIIEDNKNLQEEIFLRRREIALKPIEQQEKATREFEAWVNKKNKEFIAKYGKSFDQLTDENKRILVGVETAVNEFAKANHDFANNYKNLQKEMEKRHREILTLPYKEQEKALKELNADINKKNKAFIAKYGKSFETLNESNRQVVVALEKQ
ncbi:phage tail tape measure protein, partial [Borreliella burgdorferi]|nr:phage tail tape measure protein [Borreliella burgdorferi]MCD2421005.1 phage tail tape measure protein [Borreliella burgdorferi]